MDDPAMCPSLAKEERTRPARAFRHEKFRNRQSERLTSPTAHPTMLQVGATPTRLELHRRSDLGARQGRLGASSVGARLSNPVADTLTPAAFRSIIYCVFY